MQNNTRYIFQGLLKLLSMRSRKDAVCVITFIFCGFLAYHRVIGDASVVAMMTIVLSYLITGHISSMVKLKQEMGLSPPPTPIPPITTPTTNQPIPSDQLPNRAQQ